MRSTANALPPAVVEWVLTRLPIRKEQGAAWQAVEVAGLSDKILVALRLAAAGVGIRDAAAAAGYAYHAELSRKFREFGFSPLDRATMGQEFSRVVGLSLYEWQRRLEDAPEKFAINQLQIGAGIATDKVAKAEGWESKDARRDGNSIEQFFRRLGPVRRVSLDVGDEPERDVTPERTGSRK